MKRLLILAAVAVLVSLFAGNALAANAWGTGGDSAFAATTIYDLNQNGTATGNSKVTGHPVVGDTMYLANKIVCAMDTKATTYGLYIMEPAGGPYSGVLCYTGGDNCASALGIVVGDIVTVMGPFAQFGSPNYLNEINTGKGQNGTYPLLVTKVGHTSVPNPVRLVTGSMRVTDPCAAPWPGVLCVLDSVYVTSFPGTFAGQGLIRQIDTLTSMAQKPACMGAGIDTARVNPKLISPNPTWTAGSKIRTLVGVVSREYQWYYIAPRDLTNDVTYIGATPAPNLLRAFSPDGSHVTATFDQKMDPTTAENSIYYYMNSATVGGTGVMSADSQSITFSVTGMSGGVADTLYVYGVKGVPPNGTTMVGTQKRGFRTGISPITLIQTPGSHHDSSTVVNEWVTVQGVVTAGSSVYRSGGQVMVQDPTVTAYSGVETYSPPISVATGDNITVAGQVQEYNGKTEISNVFYCVINSSGNTVPSPVALTIPQANGTAMTGGQATAELYEDMLIATTGFVASDTTIEQSHTWKLYTGADTIKVDRNALYDYNPTPKTPVAMCAILDYYSGLWTLAPRGTSDMHCGPSGPLGVGSGNVAFALRQSTPNPFSNLTQIHFSLANPGPASLKVYNVNGQMVRTLFDGHRSAGEATATWDGRNGNGALVSSGIYYYRLSAAGQTLTKKLVLSR